MLKLTAFLAICALTIAGCKKRETGSELASTECKTADGEIAPAECEMRGPWRVKKGDTSCGGFPRVYIETGKPASGEGYCVGLVHTGDAAFNPRKILQIPGTEDFLVTDFNNWSTTDSKIWRLRKVLHQGKTSYSKEPVIEKLSLIHGLALGPNGEFIAGEDHRIFKFTLDGKTEDIITGLPRMFRIDDPSQKNSSHALKDFAFDKNGNMFVNIGAPSDSCAAYSGKECLEGDKNGEPKGVDSKDPRQVGAVLRMYPYNKATKTWDKNFKIIARGLRNSTGFVVHPKSQNILQVENARDFTESDRPHEEINVITAADIAKGKVWHYGWPYCYDFDAKSDEWDAAKTKGVTFTFACDEKKSQKYQYQPPWVLMPPHVAPLSAIYYNGDMLSELRGKLVVALHGYRGTGHRVIAFPVDEEGKPKLASKPQETFYYTDDEKGGVEPVKTFYKPHGSFPRAAQHEEIISGWHASRDYRPKGFPVTVLEATDGSIWLTDDKNHAVLRIARFNGAPYKTAPRDNLTEARIEMMKKSPNQLKRYRALREVLATNCKGCHDGFKLKTDKTNDEFAEFRYIEFMGTWIKAGKPEESELYKRIRTDMSTNPPKAPGMPPPGSNLAPVDPNLVETTIRDFINSIVD